LPGCRELNDAHGLHAVLILAAFPEHPPRQVFILAIPGEPCEIIMGINTMAFRRRDLPDNHSSEYRIGAAPKQFKNGASFY
jgi:hypothetical protein